MAEKIKIKLMCPTCGLLYNKDKTEYSRNKRLNRVSYCSIACSVKPRAEQYIKNGVWKANPQYLQPRKKDEFTPFRVYLKTAKDRAKDKPRHRSKPCEITLQDIKNVWDSQNGICPFTGWKLILRTHNDHLGKNPLLPNHASIDRIDNSKGYINGNIRFVAVIYNFARNAFTDEQVKEFCKAVSN